MAGRKPSREVAAAMAEPPAAMERRVRIMEHAVRVEALARLIRKAADEPSLLALDDAAFALNGRLEAIQADLRRWRIPEAEREINLN